MVSAGGNLSALEESTVVLPSDGIVSAAVAEQLCLLDPAGQYFMLNRLGALVWQRLLLGHDLRCIHLALAKDVDVDPRVLWGDILAFVSCLRKAKLVCN